MTGEENRRPLISAGTLLGIGIGGFVDGIVFHQLWQIHNMLSAKFPIVGLKGDKLAVNLEINMFWDGLFHAFCWIMTVGGVWLLWHAMGKREVPHSSWTFGGAIALGWGLFNLVEGIIDHHILQVHHVTETAGHLKWDLLFLGSGVVLMGVGWWMIRKGRDGERVTSG